MTTKTRFGLAGLVLAAGLVFAPANSSYSQSSEGQFIFGGVHLIGTKEGDRNKQAIGEAGLLMDKVLHPDNDSQYQKIIKEQQREILRLRQRQQNLETRPHIVVQHRNENQYREGPFIPTQDKEWVSAFTCNYTLPQKDNYVFSNVGKRMFSVWEDCGFIIRVKNRYGSLVRYNIYKDGELIDTDTWKIGHNDVIWGCAPNSGSRQKFGPGRYNIEWFIDEQKVAGNRPEDTMVILDK